MKQVFRFGPSALDGDGSMRDVLGGKGVALAEMTQLGLPVPPGFTIATSACRSFLERGSIDADLEQQIAHALQWLQTECGKSFGDSRNPLLASVRSGAAISMPGMMDTVLNVGLNDGTAEALASTNRQDTFALDCYRRFLQMFGSIVMDVPREYFTWASPEAGKVDAAADGADHLSARQLQLAIETYKRIIERHTGQAVPQDPFSQVTMAIEAVFRSWNSERAIFYRKLNRLSGVSGTAVTVQAMVFGNRGQNSGTGVGFTRNPSTGEPVLFGEYLSDAQGEDIVAGVRTPMPLTELQLAMPRVYDQLLRLAKQLEQHYRDVQDFEFTVEGGVLYLLQTRSAKRSASASVRIAVDLAREGLITREKAVQIVNPESIAQILLPQLQIPSDRQHIATGLPASPGAAVGQIALSATAAVARSSGGNPTILVTEETTADDIHGMAVSAGLLTSRGGVTSHAAVVARGMGKTCITGASEIVIDTKAGTVCIAEEVFREGDWLSLDGSSGRVFAGVLQLTAPAARHAALDELLQWARDVGGCNLRANADTPDDAKVALSSGATGIGLCRTEHMFFCTDRLQQVREMILARTREERVAALAHLLPAQHQDFAKMFRAMSSLPVTIRLLDPPLHEFLPLESELLREIAEARADENWERCLELEDMRQRVGVLKEANPMMGHRGCRLSITYPEILRMQVRAILHAALEVANEGLDPRPEILVPLVSLEQEMQMLASMIHDAAEEVFKEHGKRLSYSIGAMIELPRAAICAGGIAKHVSFASFGTNDLTQMTYGFSRDDSRRYLESYLEQNILQADPFVTIDREGVGELMRIAIDGLRASNPTIKIGICGEHGGDPDSIAFFHQLGVDYVSCSPARLHTAQLALAQAHGRSLLAE